MLIFLAAATEAVHMPSNSITQLGVGGIFALLVIDRVFTYTKGKKVVNGFQKTATCGEIVKRFDKNFESQDKRFDKIDEKLDEVKDLIRNGGK